MSTSNAHCQFWASIELSLKGRKECYLPNQLKDAIESCASIDELKTLLFAISNKNEAAIVAFDKRFDELEGA
ncbi:MAG: hypothetical protein EOO06_13480 [Chitinophagaceae bacterium]|nr:MAG: hypothetical protein EOO06_13480 [Chitinophagaceae bacterium]